MALKKTILSTCGKCEREVLPHHICAYCGFYNGREVIDVLAKLDKKEKKKRLKEEEAAHSRSQAGGGKNISELNPEELSKK